MLHLICSALQPIVGSSHNLVRGATVTGPTRYRPSEPVILARNVFVASDSGTIGCPYHNRWQADTYQATIETEHRDMMLAVQAIMAGGQR